MDMKLLQELVTRGPLIVGIYVNEDNEGNVYFSQVRQPDDQFTYIIVTGFIEAKQQIMIDHPNTKGNLPARILEGMPYLATWQDSQEKDP